MKSKSRQIRRARWSFYSTKTSNSLLKYKKNLVWMSIFFSTITCINYTQKKKCEFSESEGNRNAADFQEANDLQGRDPFNMEIYSRQESRISLVKERTFPDISSLYFYCHFTFLCVKGDTLHTSRDPESILLKFFFFYRGISILCFNVKVADRRT